MPSKFRAILIIVLGLALTWIVATRTLVAYLAVEQPEIAVRLRASDPAVLISLAEQRLQRALTPELPNTKASDATTGGDTTASNTKAVETTRAIRDPAQKAAMLAEAHEFAERALAADPLNSQVLRLIGQASEYGAPQGSSPDRDERVQKLMQTAARFSKREGPALEWLARTAYARGNYAAAAAHIDLLLRGSPDAYVYVMPTLVRMAENPNAFGELIKILARKSPWRYHFLANMVGQIRDLRAPLNILVALKGTANPATVDEMVAYFSLLGRLQQTDLSYYAWLQFLSVDELARVRHVYNGDFASKPSGLPFDWHLGDGPGVRIEIVADPDGGADRTLRVQFVEGRVEFKSMHQQLMLAPGHYNFKVLYKGQAIGRKGLEWRIACDHRATAGRAIVPIGTARNWTTLQFKFAVPEDGCRLQLLYLMHEAKSVAEQLLQGELWFKSVEIARVP